MAVICGKRWSVIQMRPATVLRKAIISVGKWDGPGSRAGMAGLLLGLGR